MPLFEVYGKDLRIEPREVGQLLLDMGQEFVPVGRYPVPVPPLHNVPRELPAALDVLPPFVVVPGSLGVVVVDHHPKDPVLHLSPVQEPGDGFLLGLVELEDYLVEQVGAIPSGDPVRCLLKVGVVLFEVAGQGHNPQCPESHPHSSKFISAWGRCFAISA